MIRAIRPAAMAQDDASPIRGWNVAPNVAYVLRLLPGSSSCGVFLYAEDGTTMVASGAALVGTEQPCILIPQAGQTIGMLDSDLGWHLLLTMEGIGSPREIRIGPAVDLPDEIHPVYGEDALALVRATAAIDAAAHYLDDVTVSCPLGLGAGLGDVVSVPVDGTAVVGQVESITWTATPDGAIEQAVIRRHVAIAPEAYVDPAPLPEVADDYAQTLANVAAEGNVLVNDADGLTVVAVNGLTANVGVAVDGNNGGSFTVNADGSWEFDPGEDFLDLDYEDTADTAISYHASDGQREAMATLIVTVVGIESSEPELWTPAQITDAVWIDADTVTLDGSAVTTMTDKVGGVVTASQGTASARPTLVADVLGDEDVIQFDGGDFLTFGTALGKPANWTIFVLAKFASTTATQHVCGSVNAAGATATAWGSIGSVSRHSEFQFGNGSAYRYGGTTEIVFTGGNWFMECQTYESGNTVPVKHINGVAKTVATDGGTATSCGGTAYDYCIGQLGLYTSTRLGNGSQLKGQLAVPRKLTTTERQKLEGYYAHKCELTSLLPSDHPYKSTPPMV